MRVEDIKPGIKIKLKSNPSCQFIIKESFDRPDGVRVWRMKDNDTACLFAEKEEALEKYYDLVEEKGFSIHCSCSMETIKKDEKHKCHCDWNDLLRYGCQCGGS